MDTSSRTKESRNQSVPILILLFLFGQAVLNRCRIACILLLELCDRALLQADSNRTLLEFRREPLAASSFSCATFHATAAL